MRPIIALALLAASAAPAVAADQAETCARFGEVTQQAAALRSSGAPQEQAMNRLVASYQGADKELVALVPQITAWVWSLPQGQLEGAGQAMEAQCKAG